MTRVERTMNKNSPYRTAGPTVAVRFLRFFSAAVLVVISTFISNKEREPKQHT